MSRRGAKALTLAVIMLVAGAVPAGAASGGSLKGGPLAAPSFVAVGDPSETVQAAATFAGGTPATRRIVVRG